MSDLSDPVYKEIVTARVKLLFEKPFFGQLAARMIAVDASKWCKTAATDGRHFYYNREFIKGLNKAELLFLIGHEVLHCFPVGTMIPGKWSPIEQIVSGDDVIGENGIRTKVVNPMCSLFIGNMFTVKARGLLPVDMTDEHPVLVRRSQWKTVGSRSAANRTNIKEWTLPEWKMARDLSVGDYVQIPRMIGTLDSPIMHFDIKANAWSSSKQIRTGVPVDAEIADFLGWYVAEGSTSQSGNGKFVSTITLNISERNVAEHLSNLLKKKFGVASSISEKLNTCRLHFSSAPLGRWLNEHCGDGALYKKIPTVVMDNIDDGIIASFLNAYISGDGSVGRSVNYGTVSKTLAYQVQFAAARLGVLFNLHERPPHTGNIRGKDIDCKALYHGSSASPEAFALVGKQHIAARPTRYAAVMKDAIWTPITKISSKFTIEPIYNIETESHTYAAGNLMTHNCVYDHLGRRGGRDPKIWNMANDYIVNWTLKDQQVGTMPAMGLYDPKYTDDLHSEQLYDLLKKNSVTIKMPLDEHLDLTGEGDGDGEGDSGGEGDKNGKGTVDVTVMGKDGPPKLTQEDIQKIRNEIKAAIIQTAQQVGAGKVPAGVRRMIQELIEPKMDWRALLDAHIRSSIKDDYTFRRVSRRTWGSGFILPAQDFMDTIDVSVSIDASGSMSETMLRDILSEVKGIMQTFRDFKLKLWTFDTTVYSFKEFTPENLDEIDEYALGGGGGTMFECNWEFMKAQGIEPQRFIMFTDGYPGGSWGDENYCDTLFVIHGNDTIKAPFGLTAYYEAKD